MRQKRKITSKLLIFGIVFILTSCSEELFDEQITSNRFKTEVVPIRKLEKDFNFKQNFQKIIGKSFESKLEQNNTTIMRGEFSTDYIILDTLANVATGEGLLSYNFEIEYPSKPKSDTLYNLVLHENTGMNNSEYFITKYLKINAVLLPVEITNSNNVSKQTVFDCITFHASPRDFPEMSMSIDWDCVDSAGGGGSSGGSSSGGNGSGGGSGASWGGGGSSTGSSGVGVLVSPHGGGGSSTTPTPPDPCTTLTEAKNDSKVQTAINDLKTKTTGKKEFAYEIERKRSLLTDSGYEYNTVLKSGNNFNTIVNTGSFVQGQAHNHPINGVAIPSFDDILWTQQCEEEISVTNEGTAFNTIVSPDPANPGGTILYSITIDNLTALQQATTAVYNLPRVLAKPNEKEKREEIMQIFGLKFVPLQNNINAQELTFLQTFASYGITLSKFNDTTGKWEKLKKDPTNPNNIIKEPCS
jgi:hypothetical protein